MMDFWFSWCRRRQLLPRRAPYQIARGKMKSVFCCCCRSTKSERWKSVPKQDLTSKDNPLTHSAIEELKSKIENKETSELSEVEEIEEEEGTMIPETQKNSGHHPPPPLLTEDGLIIPRKPTNPVRENPERLNLHRELLFNQKIGKNVLNQKSELQRALEKQKDNMAKKELESHIAAKTPELEKVIADRARRLQENNGHQETNEDKGISNEILQVRMKLKNRNDLK